MLIAKSDRPAANPRELIVELEAKVRQFAETNKDEIIFPGYARSVTHHAIGLASLIASLLLWLAFFFWRVLTDSEAVRFGFVGGALLFGLFNRLDDRQVKKRVKRYNEGARVGLGGLVQANEALFSSKNKQAAFGLAIVTMDPDLQARPERLLEMADYLYALAKEGLEPVPEYLKEVVELTRGELVDFENRVRLPRELTGNDDTWLFDLLFYPSRLPHGVVDRRLWPVIFHQDDVRVGPQVPHQDLWWKPEVDRFLLVGMWGRDDEEEDEEEAEAEHAESSESPAS